jgi:hypothetical protein
VSLVAFVNRFMKPSFQEGFFFFLCISLVSLLLSYFLLSSSFFLASTCWIHLEGRLEWSPRITDTATSSRGQIEQNFRGLSTSSLHDRLSR